jgi:hypothetical protein
MALCACDLISGGIACGCENNLGGISEIYVIDFCSINTITTGTGSFDGVVTAISTTASACFYEYCFNKNTSSLTEQAIVSIENGSLFYQQIATVVIPRREVAKRNALAMLMQKNLGVIVKDQNGLYWLIGEQNGVNVTDVNSTSGVVKGDLNGYTITFTAEEPVQAKEVSSSIITALIC